MTAETPAPPPGAPSCLVCGEPISPASAVACVGCQTPHHKDCFDYTGQCAVYGCGIGRYKPYRPEQSSLVLRMADRVLPPARERPARRVGRSTPSRPGEPPQPPEPQVVIDVFTGAEQAARLAVALGFAAAALSVITGPHPHGLDFEAPGIQPALLVLAAGLAVWFGLEDQYVFDSASRTILFERWFFGLRSSRRLWSFDDFFHVEVATSFLALPSSTGQPGGSRVYWLLLARKDGRYIHLGDAAGSASPGAKLDVGRIARRVAETMGLSVAPSTQALPLWGVRFLARFLFRIACWMATVAFCGAWIWDLIPATFLHEVFAILAGYNVSVWLYWWIVERPRAARVEWERPPSADGGEPPPRATAWTAHVALDLRGWMAVAIFTTASVCAVPWAAHQIAYNLRAALRFEQTQANIRSANLSSSGGRSPKYTVTFSYRWTVDGNTHTRTGYDVSGWRFSSLADAKETMARFPEDSTVPCWYDPARPGYAVLDRSLSIQSILLLLLGLAIQLASANYVVAWLTGRKTARRA
ncbi:MAG: DUF3592 domain-containing protein [Candidatus Wallbacteria bacterium]|nr:DUF3592 domain-containing protein [Candidatus Wallbacteria bacterium]